MSLNYNHQKEIFCQIYEILKKIYEKRDFYKTFKRILKKYGYYQLSRKEKQERCQCSLDIIKKIRKETGEISRSQIINILLALNVSVDDRDCVLEARRNLNEAERKEWAEKTSYAIINRMIKNPKDKVDIYNRIIKELEARQYYIY